MCELLKSSTKVARATHFFKPAVRFWISVSGSGDFVSGRYGIRKCCPSDCTNEVAFKVVQRKTQQCRFKVFDGAVHGD
jgi:hypothetical protein